MTTPNNALLFNAAIEGFVAGALKGRWLTAVNSASPPAIGSPDLSYDILAFQSQALSIELDALVPNDHAGAAQPAGTQPISVVTTGVAIVPSTGAIQFGELIKARLFAGLSLAILNGRPGPASVVLNPLQAAEAEGVTNIYLAAANFVEQPSSSTTINNQLLLFACYAGALAGFTLGWNSSQPADSSPEQVDFLEYAIALGVAVDALIGNDAGISAATGISNAGAALAPEPDATFSIQLSQLGKVRLMYSITLAYLESRPAMSITGATSDSITAWGVANAPAIAALYDATVLNLQTAPSSLFNPELWNQAYCGYIEGVMAGRPFTATSSSDDGYVAVGLAAKAFATEIDSTVGQSDYTSTPLNTAGNAITELVTEVPTTNSDILPTSGTTVEGQFGKGGVLWAICRGVMWGRTILGTAADDVPATYHEIAESVVACYLVLAGALNTP